MNRRGQIAAAWALITVGAIVLESLSAGPTIAAYVATLSIGSLGAWLLLWREVRVSKATLIVVAIALHAVAFAGQPAFEDDFYRFIWDGWRLIETGTPYGLPPSAAFGDPSVPPALQPILDGVNNPDLPTIYGPALELVFAALYAVFATDPLGLKLLFAAANLATAAALLRRYPPERVALFAWSPLAITETVIHLHPDGVMAALLVAAVLALRRRPAVAGLFLALATGVKLVALVLWPLLIRVSPRARAATVLVLIALYLPFFVQGQGAGFETTRTFATQWHFNPLGLEPLFWVLSPGAARLAGAAIAVIAIVWLHARIGRDPAPAVAAIFGMVLLFAPAVNSWYLLWLLPFAVGSRQIWPFAATVALPLSYLTGLNLNDPALHPFDVHPAARAAQAAILMAAVAWDLARGWRQRREVVRRPAPLPASPRLAIVIPALDEEASVGGVVSAFRSIGLAGLGPVIVVDNGSRDATAAAARAAGALVVAEPERGYGAACLAGLAALPPETDIVIFADADGSDVPQEAHALIAPLIEGRAEMVIGSRALGTVERGAMTWPQRFGNWLAPMLIRLIWGVRYTDLGPFRAIRRDALARLAMADRDFGWTVEMQVRAARQHLAIAEIPVGYRVRIGTSKISGTVMGTIRAGTKILFVVAREAFGDFGTAEARRATLSPKEPIACVA